MRYFFFLLLIISCSASNRTDSDATAQKIDASIDEEYYLYECYRDNSIFYMRPNGVKSWQFTLTPKHSCVMSICVYSEENEFPQLVRENSQVISLIKQDTDPIAWCAEYTQLSPFRKLGIYEEVLIVTNTSYSTIKIAY